MNFDFSDEQKLLKEQVRKSLDSACSLKEVRRVLETDAPYSEKAWNAVKDLGLQGAAIPEEFGGLGLGYYELCVAAEELGRALAPTPLSTSIYLAAETLMAAANKKQKEEWLPRLASGEIIAAFYEGGGEAPTFSSGAISGKCAPVYDATNAAIALLVAREGASFSVVMAQLDSSVARRKIETVDPSRDISELTFNNHPAQRIGKAGDGATIIEAVRDRAAILSAFEQLGGAERALEMARDYALQRKAFGRQIGSYQAIKHKLANIYIRVEIARAHAYYGAWALSTNASDLPLAAAAARVSATDAFAFASQENIQTHGGMGFTWEADCHLFYRRARLLALQLGNILEWKERLVKELEGVNAD